MAPLRQGMLDAMVLRVALPSALKRPTLAVLYEGPRT